MAFLRYHNSLHRRRSGTTKNTANTAAKNDSPPELKIPVTFSAISFFKSKPKLSSSPPRGYISPPQSIEGNTVVTDQSSSGANSLHGSQTQGPEEPSSPRWEAEEPPLDDSALLAPCQYINSLPSKDVRGKLVDGFNVWFKVPQNLTTVVKQVVSDLHNASLILDDIQDDSLLRRGSPATHCIYGNAQAINSATYMLMKTAMNIQALQPTNSASMDALLKGMMELFVGQSWELKWKFHTHCPTVAEYMAMIDGKTGAMFRLVLCLLHSMVPPTTTVPFEAFDRLIFLIGRFFQVRDDYINLQDDEYSEQKGFCEDLDEGKFSYPVVMCCNADPVAQNTIMGIFRQKTVTGMELSRSAKLHMLALIKRSGAFDTTWNLLQSLKVEVGEALTSVEATMGTPSPILRKMVAALGAMKPPQ